MTDPETMLLSLEQVIFVAVMSNENCFHDSSNQLRPARYHPSWIANQTFLALELSSVAVNGRGS